MFMKIYLFIIIYLYIPISFSQDEVSLDCPSLYQTKLRLKLNEVFTDSCFGRLKTKAIGIEGNYILWEHYDISTGKITSKYTTLKGMLMGWSIFYLPEGSEEGAYINGKQEGIWIVRDKMNKIIQYKLYRKGKLINFELQF